MMTRGFTRCAFVVYSEKTTLFSGLRPVSHADFFAPSWRSHAYGQDERGIYLNNLRRLNTVVESCPPSHRRATTKCSGGPMSIQQNGAVSPIEFNFQSNAIRTTKINDEVWFCANDVCKVLGYVNPRDVILKSCKSKGVAKRDTLTAGGKQELTYINEPNLYRLAIRSKKPEAEKFEEWVMEVVLPQIRKTGSYSTEATVKHELITKRFLVHFGIDNQLLMKPIPSDAIIIRKEELVNYIKSSSISTSLLFDIMGACHEEMIYRFKA